MSEACLRCQRMRDSIRLLVNQIDAIGMWGDERLSGVARAELSRLLIPLATHLDAVVREVKS